MINSTLRKLWHGLLLIAAVLLILIGMTFGLVRAALPFATEYRVEIEQLISQTLETPVRIGRLDIDWHGWGPSILLQDVVLTDSSGEIELLRLREIFVRLQLGQVLSAGPLQIADVHLEDIQLILQRNRDGGISVLGMRDNSSNSSPDVSENTANALGFLLLARRINLLNATIVLSDEASGIEYKFPKADIQFQNDGERHRIYAQIELPKEFGQRIDFHLNFVGETTRPRDWVGTSYISGRALKIAGIMNHLPASPVDWQTGTVDFSVWGYWGEGKLQSAVAQVNGEQISLHGAGQADDTGAAAWGISGASALAHWQRRDNGWDLAVGDIEISREGNVLARNDLRLVSRQNSDGERVISGNGSFLPVADTVGLLLAVAGEFATPKKLQQLRELYPHGTIRNWQFEYDATSSRLSGLKLAGELEGIGYRAIQRIPGVDGLSGSFRGVGGNFEFDINADDVLVDSASLFRQPIRIDRLRGRTRLHFTKAAFELTSSEIVLEKSALKSRLRFNFRQSDGEPLSMGMRINFHAGRIDNFKNYLPVKIMKDRLVKWLERAISGGSITRGSLLLRGAPKNFPYTANQGVFEVDLEIKDADLDYFAGWPVIRNIDARLNFSGPSLTVTAHRGKVQGANIGAVVARLKNLAKPVLELDGTLQSSVPELLRFANTGPLSDRLRLHSISGQGAARLALRLNLPLIKGATGRSVEGGITLNGASFKIEPIDTGITAVQGIIGFTEAGVRVDNLQAVFLDEPLLIEAVPHTSNDGRKNTLISVRGIMRASRALEVLAIPLGHRFVGKSVWQAELLVTRGSARRDGVKVGLRLSSDLVGTRIDLPAPLQKPAQQAVPFELSSLVAGSQNGHRWRVRYGDIVSTVVNFSSKPSPPSVSASFGGGEAPVTDTPGIYLLGHIDTLDFDGWQNALGELTNNSPNSPYAGFDAKLKVDLHIGHLLTSSLRIDELKLAVQHGIRSWRLTATNESIDGSVRVPRPFDIDSPLEVHFSKFDYDALQDDSDVPRPRSPAITPSSLPPFTVGVDELIWNGYLLKNFRVVGQPHPQGVRLDPISIDGEYLTATGTGLWEYREGGRGHNTSLNLRLESRDIGRMLKEMGTVVLIGEGRGDVNIDLQWPDAVYRPDLQIITGVTAFNFHEGRILDIEPGAGRFVGLLALNELPRRLRLDFKDALRGGMEFNKISGTVDLAGGEANTELIRMEGPIGVVDITGSVNLVERTYDQKIVFVPGVSASLPVLGVLTGGVAVGIGVLLTEGILKGLGVSLDDLGKRKYALTGTWDEPQFAETTVKLPVGDRQN